MDNDMILKLAADNVEYGDVDRLVNIYWALSSTLVQGVAGDVVEAGCHAGNTSVFLQRLIEEFAPERELHLYDSFEGLPKPSEHDTFLTEGALKVDLTDLKATFEKWELPLPNVHAGWFDETLPTQLPDRVCFAYLDGDYYESIQVSLEHIYPRLSDGGILIVDDYCDSGRNPQAFDRFSGPKRACDEFFADKPEKVSVLVGSGDLAFGYIRKGWVAPPGH
ncbi:TylF/MycF/NovP-related O-methyltransferase [Micromonospora sp. NPDC049101]|uniref:TylF/MycF/NovP-related O-methyltransferase n=1 Tax=unclassified Micromonospora TaxID=2617518 RepID=UPI0033E2E5A2